MFKYSTVFYFLSTVQFFNFKYSTVLKLRTVQFFTLSTVQCFFFLSIVQFFNFKYSKVLKLSTVQFFYF